ncbi:MAG: SsrA-binding protein [Candidatus Cloacimonadota bacterium]|nr:MAG: SsrA-binding protein [Candidatus Cloacimonadota bacterium]PIE78912.1 MAG: SsrA-binding protein [Candidatus Delongbacteria bacterium]
MATKKKKKAPDNTLARNKKAYFNYEILDKIECGIVLYGSEVKSMKAGKVSIKEAYCRFINNELYVTGMFVAEYMGSSRFTHDITRERKLLLHKRELRKLKQKCDIGKLTMVPLEIYKIKHLIKVKIGLAKGKREYEKRDAIKDREAKIDISRMMKKSNY